jgi:phosphoribosylanthranilate isomerase
MFWRSSATERSGGMRVKICGLRSRAEVSAAARSGADYVGLVFFAKSPRHLSLADAKWIADGAPDGLLRVALTVDAGDDLLEALLAEVAIDMLQLHGAESPERVADIRQRFGRPVIKAVALSEAGDLETLQEYSRFADQILVDARPMSGDERPGGNGIAFDWRLLQGMTWRVPWMLAGGLTPENVAEAVRLTGAEQVDVSSGVEYAPGYKDRDRIAAFVRAAKAAQSEPA